MKRAIFTSKPHSFPITPILQARQTPVASTHNTRILLRRRQRRLSTSLLGMERNGLERKANHEHKEKEPALVWDWDVEQEDRKREAKADASLHGAIPFEVDRRVLKDVVREKMCVELARIEFLSSGTFHKAYLITLENRVQLVARVARRFMPRLKTESEVATLQYLREHTNVPVPVVLHYDSNPFNRLGGEYILMSKANGVPLSKVYHSLPYNDVVKLLQNVAKIIIPLFAHRFSSLGSLYLHPPTSSPTTSTSAVPTPKAVQVNWSGFPFGMTPMNAQNTSSNTATPTPASPAILTRVPSISDGIKKAKGRPSDAYYVGPIISWPFFGSNRGELSHPDEVNRGPWSSSKAYFDSCAEREVKGVVRENEGKTAPHKLHLDPDEIISSRHHHLKAVPDDQSDDSDEWDLEESEDEWEGPGDAMYRDYRRMQRTTFLFTHLQDREECVKQETTRWLSIMERLVKQEEELRNKELSVHPYLKKKEGTAEEFGLDCHDLSLENVFVDEQDPTKITCIIDWESTTTRPLWQAAHLPAFLQSSPFTAKLFREVLLKMADDASTAGEASAETSKSKSQAPSKDSLPKDFAALAHEWLYYEAAGMRLRMAHRFVEWDGWEEGLAESMLGTEEFEEDWFKEAEPHLDSALLSPVHEVNADGEGEPLACVLSNDILYVEANGNGVETLSDGRGDPSPPSSTSSFEDTKLGVGKPAAVKALEALNARRKASSKIPVIAKETEKENMLDTTGDICGGRGGELGRRLEAWLTVHGHEAVPDPENSVDGPRRRWHNEEGGG
ncbi:hypothetical protein V5O48_005846 [Marasmius crinis-equi]|uniref:Aminoglycoside phosphotransferase domain-containing protein n=1 Tax=Marasmius crinis-equi TaxID=585013 RepID=A0ABR3FLK1_9AGAR